MNELELPVVALHLNALSRLFGAANFVATMFMVGLNLHEPFVHCILRSSALLLVGLPAVISCLTMLVTDSSYGTYFFVDLEGGNVSIYMHLF